MMKFMVSHVRIDNSYKTFNVYTLWKFTAQNINMYLHVINPNYNQQVRNQYDSLIVYYSSGNRNGTEHVFARFVQLHFI